MRIFADMMENREAIEYINWMRDKFITNKPLEACDLAISALEKQEQSCDTCRHGQFGSEACVNCRVRFPSHYEAEEEA